MADLRKKFQTQLRRKLQEDLKLKSIYQVPTLDKVVVNIGMGRILSGLDKQLRDRALGELEKFLTAITGQKPQIRPARISIAGFKTREGDLVGMRVTLRGQKMFDFVERLVHIVLPRMRDFHGIDEGNVDPHGVLSIGIKEHVVFPEVSQEEFHKLYGVEITAVPSVRQRDRALAVYRVLGIPFARV